MNIGVEGQIIILVESGAHENTVDTDLENFVHHKCRSVEFQPVPLHY